MRESTKRGLGKNSSTFEKGIKTGQCVSYIPWPSPGIWVWSLLIHVYNVLPLAIANAAYPLGPMLGFGAAAVFLRLPENLGGRSYISAHYLTTVCLTVWTYGPQGDQQYQIYSLFQKKHTFNCEFFCGLPLWEGGAKIPMVNYVNGSSLYLTLYLYHDMTLGQGQRPKDP